MHARELVDLAAVVTVYTPALLCADRSIPEEGIKAYWVASKCRLERWGRALKRLTRAASSEDAALTATERNFFHGILEEILASEVLTRIWAAAMYAYDRARDRGAMEPVARSVLLGHLEARHRVLMLLASRTGLTAEEAIRLDALRSRTERWTDVLIGHLASEYDVGQFAVEPERARDFAEDFAHQRNQPGAQCAWPLLVASLRSAFQEPLADESPNADLNARIAASILGCFPSEVLDGTGPAVSAWLLRISHLTTQAEQMLGELLAEVPSHGRWGSRKVEP